MYTVIGNCPKCGAPIYTYSMWHSITPPPSIPSCDCFPQSQTYTTTNHTVTSEDLKK